jgi:hypothetical protein
MLVAISGGQRVEARDAVQLAEYHCTHCGAPVVLRQSIVSRVRASSSLVTCWSHASQDHQSAKLALRDAIAPRCLRTELEWEVPWLERPLRSVEDLPADHGSDRRADLVVWSPTNRPIAIELQHSAITVKHLERRAFSYAGAGVANLAAFLEASPSRTPTGDQAGRTATGLSRYPAPRWQLASRSYNFGQLWFYEAGRAALWCGHFSPHYATVTNSPEKNINAAQDVLEYRRPSKQWRDLTLWGPYRPEELRIDLGYRAAAELGGYRYPAGPTARFAAPAPSTAVCSKVRDTWP